MKDEHLRRKNEKLKNESGSGSGLIGSPRSNRSVTPPFKVKTERPLTPVTSSLTSPSHQTQNDSPGQGQLGLPVLHSGQSPMSHQSRDTLQSRDILPIPGEKRKNTSPSTSGTKKRLTGVTLHDASKYATAKDLGMTS